jgi:hypothetical protein
MEHPDNIDADDLVSSGDPQHQVPISVIWNPKIESPNCGDRVPSEEHDTKMWVPEMQFLRDDP